MLGLCTGHCGRHRYDAHAITSNSSLRDAKLQGTMDLLLSINLHSRQPAQPVSSLAAKSLGSRPPSTRKRMKTHTVVASVFKRGGADLRTTLTTKCLLLLLVIILSACGRAFEPEVPVAAEPGRLADGQDVYGTFYAYVPATIQENPEILVLVHGTPPKDGTAAANAEFYAAAWIDFAEEHGFTLIAPAFNQEDFSSRYGDRAMSGYRGLFGREIGADEWVLRLVRAYQQAAGSADERFYLYGHSAGGQFTSRFLVTHPGFVKRAVITSAATYPQPDPEVTWPFGMGELHADIEWNADTSKHVDIVPDEGTWLAATQVPLTVIVGLEDRAQLPVSLIPGQKGRNRFTIARNWVRDMGTFAKENGMESRFELDIIPGQGHSMTGLLSYSQKALAPQ